MTRFTLSLAALVLVACSTTDKTSRYMKELDAPMTAPPKGKTLVVVHREPSYSGALHYYCNLWDNRTFFGDVGTGHACYYVCDPGPRYFISRFQNGVAVCEAQLLPDRIYDFEVRLIKSGWTGSFKIRPVRKGDPERAKVAEWTRTLRPMILNKERAPEFEAKYRDSSEPIIFDFTKGAKKDRLTHMAPDDHR